MIEWFSSAIQWLPSPSEWIEWISAFGFTQAVEIPIWTYALASTGLSLRRRLLLAFAASALTHPYVWWVFYPLLKPVLGWWGYLLVAETFAVVVEALLMRFFGLKDALLWAVLANGLSAGLGFASRGLFGWP